MQRWVKEIFADNAILGFSLSNGQVASNGNVNTVNINADKIILDFFYILQ